MKKILVTGADGFIGSHLVEALVRDGYDVKAFCLYNSFNDVGWLKDIDPEIIGNIEFIMGDIRDFNCIKSATKGVNYVFHLAALIAIPYSYVAPMSYIETNIKGTFNVLQAALENSVEQVIHTSTSEVYGTAQFVPISELHPLIGQSPYAASKIGADQIAYSFYCSYGLPVSTVRPFNTYGPRQSLRAVIPTVISQLLAHQPSIKIGNIRSTREFNFVSDTVKGMTHFLDNQRTIGEVINLGNGFEISIEELVNLLIKISNKDVVVELDPTRLRPDKSEVERLCSSNAKARKLLDWEPLFSGHTGLERGLKITYEWFSNNIHLLQDKKTSKAYVV